MPKKTDPPKECCHVSVTQNRLGDIVERKVIYCPVHAAAPELLEALKALRDRSAKDAETYAPSGNEPIWGFIEDATDAIAKAEGR